MHAGVLANAVEQIHVIVISFVFIKIHCTNLIQQMKSIVQAILLFWQTHEIVYPV